jgi:hypothetical protein
MWGGGFVRRGGGGDRGGVGGVFVREFSAPLLLFPSPAPQHTAVFVFFGSRQTPPYPFSSLVFFSSLSSIRSIDDTPTIEKSLTHWIINT